MVGKFFQEFFMFPINGERGCRLELFMRGCFERNGSAQNDSKRSCKPFQSPRVNAALVAIAGVEQMQTRAKGNFYGS